MIKVGTLIKVKDTGYTRQVFGWMIGKVGIVQEIELIDEPSYNFNVTYKRKYYKILFLERLITISLTEGQIEEFKSE